MEYDRYTFGQQFPWWMRDLKIYRECCGTWARHWKLDKNGLPPPDHHPRCDNYKAIPFAILQVLDSGETMGKVFMRCLEAQDVIEDETSSAEYFWLDTVMATVDQVEKLPEFQG